jgi:ElaB/YqjD/DUF883 family membrane-anchored ribosome-binding protein
MTATNDIKNTYQHVEDGVAERLHDASGALHHAGERLVDFKDETTRRFGQRATQLGEVMKEHPIMTIGIGIGLGYLLARLTHRG